MHKLIALCVDIRRIGTPKLQFTMVNRSHSNLFKAVLIGTGGVGKVRFDIVIQCRRLKVA